MKRFGKSTRSGNTSPKHRARKSKVFKGFNVFFTFFLAIATAFCFTCPAIADEETVSDPQPLSDPPAHHKTVEANDDGSYQVTLSVTGEETNSEGQTSSNADVVIVFDRSCSMEAKVDGNTRRLDVARTATNEFIEQILGSGDNRVSLIQFGTIAEAYNGSKFKKDGTVQWYDSSGKTTLEKVVTGIKTPANDSDNPNSYFSNPHEVHGATNWEDALTDANTAIATGRTSAKKYIIFISDGNPTCRITEGTVKESERVYYVESQFADYLLTNPKWGGAGTISFVTNSDGGRDAVLSTAEGDKTIYKTYSDGSATIYPVKEDGTQDTTGITFTSTEWTKCLHGWTSDPRQEYTQTNPMTDVYGLHGTGLTDAYLRNYNQAKRVASEERAKDVTLYGVSTAEDAYLMDNLVDDVNSTDKPAIYKDGTEDLSSVLDEIAGEIISKTRTYTNVQITDVLSKYAEFFETGTTGTVDFTYYKNGKTYTPQTKASVSGKTVTWDVNDADGDKVLDKNTTYAISFKIWPNQKAYDRAADIANGVVNDDSGTKDSDTGTNWVENEGSKYSSDSHSTVDVTGIYSNDFAKGDISETVNGKTVTYKDVEKTHVQWQEQVTTTTGGTTGTPEVSDTKGYSGYEHPVMTVPTSKIHVEKTWSDGGLNGSKKSVTFKLYKDGSVVKDKSENEVTLTLTNDGTSSTLEGDFAFAVPAGPDGHNYTVVEDPVPSNYSESYAYSVPAVDASGNETYSYEKAETRKSYSTASESGIHLQGRKAKTGTAKVTNKLNFYSLQVVKKGKLANADDSTATTLPGAGFTLYKATVGDSNAVTVGDQVGTATSGSDGKLSFSNVLVPGETYVLEETNTPSGYVTHNPIVLVVGADGTVTSYETTVNGSTITKATSGSTLSTVSNDTSTYTMTVVNTMEEYELPSAGGFGFPFAAAGLAIAVMAAGALFARRRLQS